MNKTAEALFVSSNKIRFYGILKLIESYCHEVLWKTVLKILMDFMVNEHFETCLHQHIIKYQVFTGLI